MIGITRICKYYMEMLGVIEHIVGPQERIKVISIFPTTTWRKDQILDSVKKVDAERVLLFWQICLEAPSNLAIS